MRTVIFDLDGTLADTSGDLIAAANGAFIGAGYQAPLDPIRHAAVAFAGGRAMLRAGFGVLGRGEPIELIAELHPEFLALYERDIDLQTRLYPGAMECLDTLADCGWLMGVCTNKPVGLANLLLGKLGISGYFRAVLGADSLEVRKPDPDHLHQTVLRAGGRLDRSVLVGDTVTDREAARRGKIPCILVGFGPEGAGVTALQPEAVLASYGDLPELLDGLVPVDADDGQK